MGRGKVELTGFEASFVKTIYGFAEWWKSGWNADASYSKQKSRLGSAFGDGR